MKTVVFLCFIASTLAIPNPEKRIVNGSPAKLAATAFQVSLQHNASTWTHICGGTLIAINKIVTAARCLHEIPVSQLRVKVGVLDLNATPLEYKQTIGISSYVIHEAYTGKFPGLHNDIGIITLSSPVTLNYNVKLAEMASAYSSFDNTKCIITGWGQTSGSKPTTSPILLEGILTKISTEDCKSRWPRQGITSKHTCVYEDSAPYGKRPSACMGDGGGPMMCGGNFTQLDGIASFGPYNCDGNYPSVYTRVSAYRDWIDARL